MDFMTAVRTCLSKYVDFSRPRTSVGVLVLRPLHLPRSVSSRTSSTPSSAPTTTAPPAVASSTPWSSLGRAAARRSPSACAASTTSTAAGGGSCSVIIPIIGWIILIVWYCTDTKPGDNQYGPNPKTGPTGAYPPPPPAAPYGSGQYGG